MQGSCSLCSNGSKIHSAQQTLFGLQIKAMTSVSQNALRPQRSDGQETDCTSTSAPSSASLDSIPMYVSHWRNFYHRDSARDINQCNIFRGNQRAFTNTPRILPASPNHSQVTPAAIYHNVETMWLRQSPAVPEVSGNCTNAAPTPLPCVTITAVSHHFSSFSELKDCFLLPAGRGGAKLKTCLQMNQLDMWVQAKE